VNIWKTVSENFYEGKFGISGELEETWGGGGEKFSDRIDRTKNPCTPKIGQKQDI
jgi:hypothetical protein